MQLTYQVECGSALLELALAHGLNSLEVVSRRLVDVSVDVLVFGHVQLVVRAGDALNTTAFIVLISVDVELVVPVCRSRILVYLIWTPRTLSNVPCWEQELASPATTHH